MKETYITERKFEYLTNIPNIVVFKIVKIKDLFC